MNNQRSPYFSRKYFRYSLSFIGVLFFALMVFGGFMWMTARGNEEQTKSSEYYHSSSDRSYYCFVFLYNHQFCVQVWGFKGVIVLVSVMVVWALKLHVWRLKDFHVMRLQLVVILLLLLNLKK